MPRVRIPAFPKNFQRKKNVDVAEVNHWGCIEESGQSLESLIMASSKQVLQKSL